MVTTTMSALVSQKVCCPYCGEYFEALLDNSQGDSQYTEDCYICCRPIIFNITVTGLGDVSVNTYSEDESF